MSAAVPSQARRAVESKEEDDVDKEEAEGDEEEEGEEDEDEEAAEQDEKQQEADGAEDEEEADDEEEEEEEEEEEGEDGDVSIRDWLSKKRKRGSDEEEEQKQPSSPPQRAAAPPMSAARAAPTAASSSSSALTALSLTTASSPAPSLPESSDAASSPSASSPPVTFASLGVCAPLVEACTALGWHSPTQIQAESLPHSLAGRDIIGLAETGSGKCFAAGTRLRLYSGETAAVEQIVDGQQLMGDDGTPRVVTPGSLARGRAVMYRIQPSWEGASAFTVNGDHILVLRVNRRPSMRADGQQWTVSWFSLSTSNELQLRRRRFSSELAAAHCLHCRLAQWQPLEWEVSVDAFLASAASVRRHCLLFQCAPVTFHSRLPRLDERLNSLLGAAASEAQREWAGWFLGLWISAGGRHDAAVICSALRADDGVKCASAAVPAAVRRAGAPSTVRATRTSSYQLGGSSGTGFAWRLLDCYGLLHGQRMPTPDWLCDSVEMRRQVLAGMIDGGDRSPVAGNECELRLQHEAVAVGCKELAGSLGIRSSAVNAAQLDNAEAVSFCLRLSGQVSGIVRLCAAARHLSAAARKEEEEDDGRCFGFTVTAQAVDDYYGFAVTGNNRRFLLADFTVTHNVSAASASSLAALPARPAC